MLADNACQSKEFLMSTAEVRRGRRVTMEGRACRRCGLPARNARLCRPARVSAACQAAKQSSGSGARRQSTAQPSWEGLCQWP